MNAMKLVAFAAAFVFGLFLWVPSAQAQPLPNGYDTTCVKANDTQVICTTTGCPRVSGDEAGDVIHTKVQGGPQNELSLPCNSTTSETINTSSGFDYGVQGCRKHSLSSDDCGAWANYHYTAPPTQGPVEQKQPDPVKVPENTDTGQGVNNVPAAVPVTDAITANINPGLGSVSVDVQNSSDLNGKCVYNSTPLGKPRNFNVPAHGGNQFSISGINTGTTYHVTIDCTDASGKQSQPIGHVEQDVTF